MHLYQIQVPDLSKFDVVYVHLAHVLCVELKDCLENVRSCV